jgi:O-antigen ligase
MPWSRIAGAIDRLGRGAVIALGFSIPVSVAVDNLLLATALACFVLRGNYRETFAFLAERRVLLAPAILFGLLALGTLYGPATADEAWQHLFKYDDLVLIPVLASFCREPATRRAALYAFCAAVVVTVLLSFALYTGALVRPPLLVHDEAYPVPFKHSLTHSIVVALGTYVFVQLAAAARSPAARLTWSALAVLAAANIMLAVPGRTGIVVLGALALYVGVARWRWAGLARMAALLLLVLAAAYHASDRFHDRVARALDEFAREQPSTPAGPANAVGLRLEFYRNSLSIVRDHPVLGVGTGGFAPAYREKVQGSGMVLAVNPHNEYLLIAVQVGIVGLLELIAMLYMLWRRSAGLSAPLERELARGIVLTIAVGCAFNSLLLDHTEGLLFAWFTGVLYGGLQNGGKS